MNLIELYKEADNFVKKNDLSQYAAQYQAECSIGNVDELAKVLQELCEKDRCLRIGIIGRVKAGKSSLLNALLFNGQDILPKAATPMTAALTVMEYSDTVSAELDFFDEKDIVYIKERYDQYLQLLQIATEQKLEILEKRQKDKKKSDSGGFLSKATAFISGQNSELQKKAQNAAEREMKKHPDYAAYDQYQRINNSGLKYHELAQHRHIAANSINELMDGKLTDFVGAQGRFMPFTKSVTLCIPHKGLKGLEVIDTPGINDPVQSRGKRTEEMLQSCDVVFLVSPAGQFLSQEDMNLMQRIADREGIQEIYIIASQVDNQILGSEARGLNNPIIVLEKVTSTLTEYAHSVLKQHIQKASSTTLIYEKALQHNVICTSGAAYSMEQHFTQKSSWDSSLQHIWQNLSNQYRDTFNEPESAKAALSALANIDLLHDKLENVRKEKETILDERRKKLESDKRKALSDYLTKLETYINNQISVIEKNDLEQLKKQLWFLNSQTDITKNQINMAYTDLIFDFDIELNDLLGSKVKQIMQEFETDVASARSTTEETYRFTIDKSWYELWKDKYEIRTRTVDTVNASHIRRGIESIRANIEDSLNATAKKYRITWRKELQKKIVQTLRGDDGVNDQHINIGHTSNVLARLINAIKDPDFTFQDALPEEVDKSGVLKGDQAENFIEHAQEYIHNLKMTMLQETKSYVHNMVIIFKNVDLGEELTQNLKTETEKCIEEMANKEISLHRYKKMQAELSELQKGVLVHE